MLSLTQKHDISPFNGPISTFQMSASLIIIVIEATTVGGVSSTTRGRDQIFGSVGDRDLDFCAVAKRLAAQERGAGRRL